MEPAIDYLLDPIAGNNAKGKVVHGVVCLHVDDVCMAGDDVFRKTVNDSIKKDFAVGSVDTNDIMFVGQRLVWKDATASTPAHISVNQDFAVEAVEETTSYKKLKNEQSCIPQQHTAYRSVLGGRGVTCVFFLGVTCVFFLGVACVFSAGSEATVSNERPPGGPLFQPPAAWNKPAEKDPLTPYTHIHGLAYTLIYISAKVISLLHASVASGSVSLS